MAKFPEISHFFNLHDSFLGRHVNAASCKSLEIQAYSIDRKTKNPFEAKICLTIISFQQKKKTRQENERRGEERKQKERDCCVPLQPKNCACPNFESRHFASGAPAG